MTQKDVHIVSTGTANIASVMASLRRLHAQPQLEPTPAQVLDADYVVLPGVGAFGAAVEMLKKQQLFAPLRERILAGKPTFAICLGLQLFCEASEESDGFEGLGIVPGVVKRFTGELRIPQFGWSGVKAAEKSHHFRDGYAYYANSYCLRDIPEGWDVAVSEYGGEYVAAMAKGDVVACQFHPELSGKWGQSLMSRWLSGQMTDNGRKS